MSDEALAPEVFTADYVGEPGRRTFYVQARGEFGTHSFLIEKQQVELLAEKLRELLLAVDSEDTVKSATPERDPALALTEPGHPKWRVGTIGLGYQESDERVLVFLQEVSEQDLEETEDLDDSDVPSARFMLRRDQARAFVLHALAAVGEGRPLCQLCGLPMDPTGHNCPASNGHRTFA